MDDPARVVAAGYDAVADLERRLAALAGLEVLEAEAESQVQQGREVPSTWLLERRPFDQLY